MDNRIIKVIFSLFLFLNVSLCLAAQDDTVKVVDEGSQPIIDGKPDDTCWHSATWQAIDQVWIPYGSSFDSSDFTGYYKVVWSQSSNLIYFLVEIVDDVFVDGYVYNSNPEVGGGYPNYDIVEVFIDENKSGGLHVFDGTGNTGTQWGTNAENAFSYHIAADAPSEGETTREFVVCDIAGKSWADYHIPNFRAHLPEFALRKMGSKYYWEFSLAVYSDAYHDSNPEVSRVTLLNDKIFGLSLAYCDNDDPQEEPKTRDHFFGSVSVSQDAYNDHWMNANGYGTARLVSGVSGVEKAPQIKVKKSSIYPNPSAGKIYLSLEHAATGDVKIKIYDILGRVVYHGAFIKNKFQFNGHITITEIPSGMYFIIWELGGERQVDKIVILNRGKF